MRYSGFTVGYHYEDDRGAILFKQLVRIELPESVEVPVLDGKNRQVVVLSHIAPELEIGPISSMEYLEYLLRKEGD